MARQQSANLLSSFACALSLAIDSEVKWNNLSQSVGASNRLTNSSGEVNGRRIGGGCSLGNHRLWFGIRDKGTNSSCFALWISDHMFQNSQYEVPSPMEWFIEHPMKTPSRSSVTWTVNKGLVWLSWFTALSWSNNDWTTTGTSRGESMSDTVMGSAAWMKRAPGPLLQSTKMRLSCQVVKMLCQQWLMHNKPPTVSTMDNQTDYWKMLHRVVLFNNLVPHRCSIRELIFGFIYFDVFQKTIPHRKINQTITSLYS